MSEEEGPELLFPSETWDPRNHTRLHFPVLEHADARPEQAPSQGVRELLYQFEAVQAVSRAPLNIFWNDEEFGDNRSLEEVEFDEDGLIRGRNAGAARPVLFNAVTIFACLMILSSTTALVVGTICVFGQCGPKPSSQGESTTIPPPPVVVTRNPSAAPSRNIPDNLGFSDDVLIPITDGNIFDRPTTSPPSTRPTGSMPPPTLIPTIQNLDQTESTLTPSFLEDDFNSTDDNSTSMIGDNSTSMENTTHVYHNETVFINATATTLTNNTAALDGIDNATSGNQSSRLSTSTARNYWTDDNMN